MADFIVVGFEGGETAETVLQELLSGRDMDLNLDASAVVSRNPIGEITVSTPVNNAGEKVESTVAGSISGGAVGLLVGAMIGNPAIGLLTGTAFGGIAGAGAGNLDELGLDSRFNHEVGQALDNDSSAICFLLWDQTWDELPDSGVDKIRSSGGQIIRTTLAVSDENELRSLLEG